MARLPFDPEKTRAAQAGGQQGATPANDPPGGKQPHGSHGEPSPASANPSASPLTVSQVAARLKTALGDHFPQKIRVVGEVSNLSDRAHWFFSLKDEQATLRCVCFAPNARKVGFKLADGMQVVATGRVDFYDQQGHVQIYVDKIEPVGQGALELQLRQLIDELRRRGYFDETRKRLLPAVPRRVAVVTSRSAAALQDVINTARRRWPGCELLLYDVRVQGEGAAPEITRAIEKLSEQGAALGVDALILTRGGGSIEDLWAFNERSVADALYQCAIPTVAAIGHETDTTVAELVADQRCSTPTQAAMAVIPDRETLQHQVDQLAHRLATVVQRRIDRGRHRLHLAARHALFRQPRQLANQARRRLDDNARRLKRALPRRLQPARKQLSDVEARWRQLLPRRLRPAKERVDRLETHLRAAMPRRVTHDRRRLDAALKHLEAVGPHNVLKRGYSYTLDEHGALIKSAGETRPGQWITTVLHDGRVQSRVNSQPDQPTSADQNDHKVTPSQSAAPEQSAPPAKKAAKRKANPPADQGGLFDT
jgi:exodeoxyribonuclease VII large subunit